MIHLTQGKKCLVCLSRAKLARLSIGLFLCGMVSGAALYRLVMLVLGVLS